MKTERQGERERDILGKQKEELQTERKTRRDRSRKGEKGRKMLKQKK